MSKLTTIQGAAAFFGVSPQTLRRWEREGRGIPFQKTAGGQRRYDLTKIHPKKMSQQGISLPGKEQITLGYARVSSHDQKEDLQRQEKMLEMFCSS